MAIIEVCHMGPAAGSGAASAVVNHLGVVESHRICHREWSRIMTVNTACQGVMGPLLEPRRIRCRTWNRIMIVIATCRGGADLSIEVRPRLESGLRRSPGGTALMS